MAPEGIEGIEDVQPRIISPPEDPSLHTMNGMAATMAVDTSHHQINGSSQGQNTPSKSSEILEPSKSCRINIMLVTFILCIGLAVTILGVYMHMTTPISARDCAIWSGVPLTISGIMGIYYCGHEFAAYARSMRAFVVKCICLIMVFVSCWLAIMASVFAGLHLCHIFSYIMCKPSNHFTCSCVKSSDPFAQEYQYTYTDCGLIRGEFWKFLLSQCALNGFGSLMCLWLLFMLWKSRYHGFYAGLRFYSYSATLSPHPRVSV